MKQIPLEFSRPIEVARVSKLGSHEHITADADECNKLAKRLMVPGVHAVSAKLLVKSWRGGGYKVSGTATADLDQTSVVSLESFRSTVNFSVERFFLPRLDETADEEVDQIENGIIDIGEVVAETLALELDPYPRAPGEAFDRPMEDDDRPSANVSPFARLKPKA
jgi:uncharacterized metal-binding protein YceD (DUF177 family)